MAKVDYLDDELDTKASWDRLFWIEIAKRKERQTTGDAQRSLVRLHDEIVDYFDSTGQDLDEPIEGATGASALLNTFQFGGSPAAGAYDSGQADLLRAAMTRFQDQIDRAAAALQFLCGFRLADFAAENDIELMWSWWALINSSAGRKEMRIEKGNFSSHSEPHLVPDEDDPSKLRKTISFYSRPGRSPIPVTNKYLHGFSTDIDSVVINGQQLTDSVVVVFDFNNPPSKRDIANVALAASGMVSARRMAAAMGKGDFAELQRLTSRSTPPLELSDYLPLPTEHQLFKAQNSVAPILRGLYAWDLVHESKLTAAEAARKTTEDLSGLNTTEKNVINALSSISSKINEYAPSLLPWRS